MKHIGRREQRWKRHLRSWRIMVSFIYITSENQLFPQKWTKKAWNKYEGLSFIHNHTETVHIAGKMKHWRHFWER
jgi:hypothetical protein